MGLRDCLRIHTKPKGHADDKDDAEKQRTRERLKGIFRRAKPLGPMAQCLEESAGDIPRKSRWKKLKWMNRGPKGSCFGPTTVMERTSDSEASDGSSSVEAPRIVKLVSPLSKLRRSPASAYKGRFRRSVEVDDLVTRTGMSLGSSADVRARTIGESTGAEFEETTFCTLASTVTMEEQPEYPWPDSAMESISSAVGGLEPGARTSLAAPKCKRYPPPAQKRFAAPYGADQAPSIDSVSFDLRRFSNDRDVIGGNIERLLRDAYANVSAILQDDPPTVPSPDQALYPNTSEEVPKHLFHENASGRTSWGVCQDREHRTIGYTDSLPSSTLELSKVPTFVERIFEAPVHRSGIANIDATIRRRIQLSPPGAPPSFPCPIRPDVTSLAHVDYYASFLHRVPTTESTASKAAIDGEALLGLRNIAPSTSRSGSMYSMEGSAWSSDAELGAASDVNESPPSTSPSDKSSVASVELDAFPRPPGYSKFVTPLSATPGISGKDRQYASPISTPRRGTSCSRLIRNGDSAGPEIPDDLLDVSDISDDLRPRWSPVLSQLDLSDGDSIAACTRAASVASYDLWVEHDDAEEWRPGKGYFDTSAGNTSSITHAASEKARMAMEDEMTRFATTLYGGVREARDDIKGSHTVEVQSANNIVDWDSASVYPVGVAELFEYVRY